MIGGGLDRCHEEICRGRRESLERGCKTASDASDAQMQRYSYEPPALTLWCAESHQSGQLAPRRGFLGSWVRLLGRFWPFQHEIGPRNRPVFSEKRRLWTDWTDFVLVEGDPCAMFDTWSSATMDGCLLPLMVTRSESLSRSSPALAYGCGNRANRTNGPTVVVFPGSFWPCPDRFSPFQPGIGLSNRPIFAEILQKWTDWAGFVQGGEICG